MDRPLHLVAALGSLIFGASQVAYLDLVLVPKYLVSLGQTKVGVRSANPAMRTRIVRDLTPRTGKEAPAKAAPPLPRTVRRWVVLFTFGKHELTRTAQLQLSEALSAFRTGGHAEIVIEGHADALGDPNFNKMLSESRAQSVAQWFLDRGVSHDKLKVRFYGAERSTRSGAGSNRQDRRVEIIMEGA